MAPPSPSSAIESPTTSASSTVTNFGSSLSRGITGKLTGNFAILGPQKPISLHEATVLQRLFAKFPTQINRENILKNREFLSGNREFHLHTLALSLSVHFLHACFL